MKTPGKDFSDLLSGLGVAAGDLVYLHTSYRHMSYRGLSPAEILDVLTDVLGERGTLVLPSFAWNLDKTQRPWKGYADYFASRPPFDVVNTPANIGALPELFRKQDGVRRSANYWWSVCTRGPLAADITHGQENVVNPYGPLSSFDILRTLDVKVLGLGVSLNTTSLAPVCDFYLDTNRRQQIFTDQPQRGVVFREDGVALDTWSIWLLPGVVRWIKPNRLIESSSAVQAAMRRIDAGSTIQFCYPFRVYFEEALAIGSKCLAAGRTVPWLENYVPAETHMEPVTS